MFQHIIILIPIFLLSFPAGEAAPKVETSTAITVLTNSSISTLSETIGRDDRVLAVSQLRAYLLSTPTPTPSLTLTPTPGITPSLTPTPSITPSLTPTPDFQATASAIVAKSATTDSQTYIRQEERYDYRESKLVTINPHQLTPSKEDLQACHTFWEQQPQGYNETQITHCYPLSAVGRFQIFFEEISEPFTCSGAVIGPHTVLTAAHCFPGLKTTKIEFTPGQFGDYKPFGSFQNGSVYKPDEFVWGNASNDYAVVKFSEEIGALTGWLGVEYYGCDDLEAKRGYDLMLAGFSDDKDDQMWMAECNETFVDQCANGDASGMFRHICDTKGGASGAPLIEDNVIVGVHSGYINHVDKNTATYVSRQLMDFIQQHIS